MKYTHQPYWSVLSQVVHCIEKENIRTFLITNEFVAWRHSAFIISVAKLNTEKEVVVSMTCGIRYIMWNNWEQIKNNGFDKWKWREKREIKHSPNAYQIIAFLPLCHTGESLKRNFFIWRSQPLNNAVQRYPITVQSKSSSGQDDTP